MISKSCLNGLTRDRADLGEREALKLLRRVFEEQFEVVEGTLQPRLKRSSCAVHNPHDPDAHYADKGKKQWVRYKVHVAESVEPKQPATTKGYTQGRQITEIVT